LAHEWFPVRAAAPIAWLVVVALSGFGVGLAIWGIEAVVPATLGLAITLPTAAVTLHLIRFVWRLRPDAGPVAVVTGTFLRMVWAAAVVFVLRGRAADFGTTPEAIANWTAGMYVLTLATETFLLWRLLADRPTREVTGDDATPH
jgi:hypothetical protein